MFSQIPLPTHASRHLGEHFRKFSAKTNEKIETISQKPSKTGFLEKMTIFWHFLPEKIPHFEFSHGYHYSHTLVDT